MLSKHSSILSSAEHEEFCVNLPGPSGKAKYSPWYILPDYVCPFAVRVPLWLSLADFLGSLLTSAVTPPEGFVYCQVRLSRWICLPRSAPTPFNALFRQRAGVSLLRLRIAHKGSKGILTLSAIGLAFRLILRSRLTPGRLTLPGKP